MTSTYTDEAFLFQPQGRLDHQGAAKLKQQVSLVESEQYSLWIIDLAQVTFIDSAGLLALVNTLHVANRIECRLAICNLTPSVKVILEITQLDQVFEIIDSSSEILDTAVQTRKRASSISSDLAAA